ncbi:zinc metalloproteinase nas-13-like [Uranotaenia lowii]|uniref:zinc metalloproteinase nas-13-like n=1 Tax=Uranotaenia lowii TaxID=190385 RepID=UPI002479BE56|nr:zinc metalloproteinase nas-13-like [Uranotaenia lowii]
MGTLIKSVIVAIVLTTATISGAPIDDGPPEIVFASELEEAGHFEGDILLLDPQRDIIQEGRNSLIGAKYKWPGNILYYYIEPADFTAVQQNSIKAALDLISLSSCITFVPRTTQAAYVQVTGEYTGCWSYLGRVGNAQQLNLQPNGCLSRGTIMHEFLHALGFVHMQSSSDRDFFVQIDWSKVSKGSEHNFDRYSSAILNDFGIAYDYDSVMHYSRSAFSIDGKPTIIPVVKDAIIGQRVGMSVKDIKRLNEMYCNS